MTNPPEPPGWAHIDADHAQVCSTCLLAASRYIGPLGECDACNKYRERTGKPRPQRLIDRAERLRYERDARKQELDWLRANNWTDAGGRYSERELTAYRHRSKRKK